MCDLSHDPDEDAVLHCYCPLDVNRVCGEDCMAYCTSILDGPDYKEEDGKPKPWAYCKILLVGHQIAKHLVVLANKAEELQRFLKNSKADELNRTPPVVPASAPPVPLSNIFKGTK